MLASLRWFFGWNVPHFIFYRHKYEVLNPRCGRIVNCYRRLGVLGEWLRQEDPWHQEIYWELKEGALKGASIPIAQLDLAAYYACSHITDPSKLYDALEERAQQHRL